MDNKIIGKLSNIISQKKDITFAYLHGSCLNQQKFNDIDIGIYVDEKVTGFIDLVDFEISMGLEIGKVTRIPVDVKILNFAPLGFKYHTSCGKLLFSRDEDKRIEFLCNTWLQYFDFRHIAQVYLQEVLSA
jgi:hypothetical protein